MAALSTISPDDASDLWLRLVRGVAAEMWHCSLERNLSGGDPVYVVKLADSQERMIYVNIHEGVVECDFTHPHARSELHEPGSRAELVSCPGDALAVAYAFSEAWAQGKSVLDLIL